MQPQRPYRIFDAVLARRAELTPHLARLTFAGPDIAGMTTHAPDQRIKLFFPKEDGTPPAIPNRPDWYDIYRSVPPRERVPMRTYTIRHLRADDNELDVDFVLHGDAGPASKWALGAEIGAPLQISAPNRHHGGEVGGFDWEPPAGVANVLLIADETALPAVAGIMDELAGLSAPPRAQVFIEVPTAADRLPLAQWPGREVTWFERDRAGAGSMPHGQGMIAAAEAARLPASAFKADADLPLPEIDVDEDILWDRADAPGGGFYGWVAGETAAVSRIRTMLIKERGVGRHMLTLMGYWRYGKVKE